MDPRRKSVLLTFIIGYVVITGVLFLLIPYLGSQVVIEGLVVWIIVVLAIALYAGRSKKGPMSPKSSKPTGKRGTEKVPR